MERYAALLAMRGPIHRMEVQLPESTYMACFAAVAKTLRRQGYDDQAGQIERAYRDLLTPGESKCQSNEH